MVTTDNKWFNGKGRRAGTIQRSKGRLIYSQRRSSSDELASFRMNALIATLRPLCFRSGSTAILFSTEREADHSRPEKRAEARR